MVAGALLPGGNGRAQTAEPSYLIQQSSAQYGTVTAMATPHNFRMDAMGMKFYLKPPFKSLNMYCDANKMTYACTVDRVSKRINLRKLSEKQKKAGTREVITRLPDVKLVGFNCTHHLFEHVTRRGERDKVAEIWTTSESRLPKEMETSCAKLTDCPLGYGFPVRIYSFNNDRPVKMLETNKVENRQFNHHVFVEPQNYKPARDEVELMMAE